MQRRSQQNNAQALSELDQLIATLTNSEQRVLRPRRLQINSRSKPIRRKCLYRTLSISQQKQIIALHFGNLTQVQFIQHSFRDIANLLNINETTVRNVIGRYKSNGNRVVSRKNNCGRRLSQNSIDVMNYIRDNQRLQDWAPLSLRERANLINHNTRMKIDASALCKLYKRIGIAYRIPQQVYLLSRQKQIQVDQQRSDFALYLARLIFSEKRHICYLDETTFHFHLRSRRTWSYDDERVEKPISNTRFSGVTLFGAIGDCLKHPVFMTAESTSSQSFQSFIINLCSSLKENQAKPVLLMDNHTSHFNQQSRTLLNQHFDVTFIPAYSCQFNSIETLWAIIKQQFRKQVALQLSNIKSQAALNDLVIQTAIRVPQRISINVCKANHQYILKWLERRKQGNYQSSIH